MLYDFMLSILLASFAAMGIQASPSLPSFQLTQVHLLSLISLVYKLFWQRPLASERPNCMT